MDIELTSSLRERIENTIRFMTLDAVARVNSGTFREVKVTPALVEVARQRSRPYHAKGPGEVWGTEVPIRRTPDE